MDLRERIRELREALAASHSCGDWRQRTAHPEEHEASGWGAADVIAENPTTKKWESILRVYDSGNQSLVLAMRKHIDALIAAVEALPNL